MLDFHNIWMAKKPEKLNFPKDACGIGNMFKDIIYLFNGNFFSKMGIICRADDSIATFANNFLNFISASFTIFCEEIYICLQDKRYLIYISSKNDLIATRNADCRIQQKLLSCLRHGHANTIIPISKLEDSKETTELGLLGHKLPIKYINCKISLSLGTVIVANWLYQDYIYHISKETGITSIQHSQIKLFFRILGYPTHFFQCSDLQKHECFFLTKQQSTQVWLDP